ncbi:Ig-like domain-containing protein [Clostridium novyi]|uniref:Ig-like domain-containing protein n=1 Tax=Clostridium novyi TaxID=1542 RepID=UPI00069F31B4|nr:Ig-like domain-containing protein [Clostridium novyi]
MSNNKTLKVFSSTAVAGMIAAAMMSSQAFAAVDAYSVKVGDQIYKYDRVELEKSFLDSKAGDKAALYEDFTKKLGEAKGFYAFKDTKNGYVDCNSIEAKFLEAKNAGQKFDVNAFTESKDAKIVEVKSVKKAVVNKDGNVEYVTESKEDEKGDLKVTSVEVLNLKQVKINFNKAVTDDDRKDDIEDEENYTLKDKDNSEVKDAIKEVKLDENKKSATLTFNDVTNSSYKGIKEYIIENQEKYTLVIDEEVTGNDEEKKVIKFSDATLPEVKGISVVGADTIKVTFSEPVMPENIEKISAKLGKPDQPSPILGKDDFNIVDTNNDDVNIRRVELVNDNKEANIILSSDLKDKEKVKVKVKASVRDYAGLSVLEAEAKTVEAKRDTKAPIIVDSKDVKDDKVTLVFDKEIKVKDSDSNEIKGEDLKKIYQTSDKAGNYAKKATIDGKELKIEFDTDSLNNEATIYLKSGLIESRWEVENDKLSKRVVKNVDNTKPEVKKVEQDTKTNNKIKVKFSKKVKCDDANKNKDENALNKSNYTLKDDKGREWSIDKIEKDGSDKEFVVKTIKDLDDDKEYTLEIKNIEDKDGNAIAKTKKKFKVVDNDAVKEADVKVKAYSIGTSDQKIVVDFDSTMKFDDSKYSVNDLSKYTLVSDKAEFDGKHAINLSEVYRANKKKAKNGRALEITMPGKEGKNGKNADLHDKQFNLSENSKYTLQIDRVSDNNGNVTEKNFEVEVTTFSKNNTGITFDMSSDYEPQINALDRISFSFNDKVNFNESDIKVVVAKTAEKAKELAGLKMEGDKLVWKKADMQKAIQEDKTVGEGVLDIAKATPSINDDGNTQIDILMDKMFKDKAYDDSDNNHIFTYDGHFMKRDENKKALTGDDNKLNVYVVVVPSKGTVTETDNEYDQTVAWGTPILVQDKLAPAIQDNNVRDKKAKFIYVNHAEQEDKNNTDKIVQYFYNKEANVGSIVLTFEEDLAENSIGTTSVELNKDDFKDAKVSSVKVNKNKVIINVIDLVDTSKDKDSKDYKKELNVGSRFALKSVTDKNNNEASKVDLEVGDFKKLKANEVDADFDKTVVGKAVKVVEELKKLPQIKDVDDKTDVAEAEAAIAALKATKAVDVSEYEKQVTAIKDAAKAKKDAAAEAANLKDAQEKVAAYEALAVDNDVNIKKAVDSKAGAKEGATAAVAKVTDEAKRNELNGKITAQDTRIDTAATVATVEVAGVQVNKAHNSTVQPTVVMKNAAGVTLDTAVTVKYAWTVESVEQGSTAATVAATKEMLNLTNQTTKQPTATVTNDASGVDAGDNWTIKVVVTQNGKAPVEGTGKITAK